MSYINTINNDNTNYLIAGVSNIIVCSTNASTVAKTATAMDGFSLDSNLSFKIIFTNGNTASSPTLNLNSTGAKSLTTTTSDYTLVANMLYDCYYNGTSYVLDNTVTVHTAKTSNPHGVTKAQVGLGNCDNTADSNKVVSSASKLTTARKTYVTLGTASTTTTIDWSGDTTIPVSGILGVANGGTGTTSLSNITVGNSSKLGNYSVKTSSIGGNSTESTNYWTYVTKSKFTSTGGYIKYSNGLLIQWGLAPSPSSGNTIVSFTSFGIEYTTVPAIMVTTRGYSDSDNGNSRIGQVIGTKSGFHCDSNFGIETKSRLYWMSIGY